MKTKYVRPVHSAKAAPSLESVAGPRVKRLISTFASLVTLRPAVSQSPSGSKSPASSGARPAPLSASRQWNSSTARRASARATWRRAKLFA